MSVGEADVRFCRPAVSPSTSPLRDRLAGNVGNGTPAALLVAVLDIMAVSEAHRAQGSRPAPARSTSSATSDAETAH